MLLNTVKYAQIQFIYMSSYKNHTRAHICAVHLCDFCLCFCISVFVYLYFCTCPCQLLLLCSKLTVSSHWSQWTQAAHKTPCSMSRNCKNFCFPNKYFLALSSKNARIANTVQGHSLLSGNKDCHEFRFPILRIVICVSIVTSPFALFGLLVFR